VFSSIKDLGGGVLFDQIHEIDTLLWLLGPAKSVIASVCNSGGLEIEKDVEDYALLNVRLESGIIASIHLDYFRRDWKRTCTLIGAKGTLEWNQYTGQTAYFDADKNKNEVFSDPQDFERNTMYLDEMKNFLNNVLNQIDDISPAREGKATLALVMAAKKSSQSGKEIQLAEFL
jgi:predicted dehydrogenase